MVELFNEFINEAGRQSPLDGVLPCWKAIVPFAKQLSTAGFSVVVLEQGGWGKYGREHEYTKDELLNRNPADDDRLMTNPRTQPNTFRRTAADGAGPGSHSYGCVVGGGTVTYGGSSWRHLPWEFNEARITSIRYNASSQGRPTLTFSVAYKELTREYVGYDADQGWSGSLVHAYSVSKQV